jgi:ribonuclease P protein component
VKELDREADLSTQQPEAVPDPRLPQADVDAGGTPGAESSSRQGPQASVRLSSGDRVRAGGRDRRSGWRALSSRRDFSRVYEAGVKRIGRLFVLYMYPGDDLARAVVASRRVGGAVARNRAKRLLRVAIRGQIEDSPATAALIRERWLPDAPPGEGLWVVAVARARIVSARSREVVAELEQLLDRPADGPARPESC